MNNGTKLRTLLRIIVSANTAVYAVSAAVNGLNFGIVTLIWTVLTIASVTTYYNNDYNETSAKYTGMMRLEKQQLGGKIDGENFYDEIEDGGESEEEYDEEFTDEEGDE